MVRQLRAGKYQRVMLTHITRFFCLSLLLAVANPLVAQEPLYLEDAVATALNNSFQKQIADQDLFIAQNNNDWGTAGRYPTVTAGVNTQNGFTNSVNPANVVLPEFSQLSSAGAGNVDATWVLFNGGRVKTTKRQLELLEQQGEIGVSRVVEQVVSQVSQAYYLVLIQGEQLDVLEEILSLSADRIEYQEVRQEFGQAGSFDLLQAQDALLVDSTNFIRQMNAYNNAVRNLNIAMGVEDINKDYNYQTPLEFAPSNYDLAALQQQLLGNNKDLQDLQMARELALVNTELQRASWFPSVSLSTGVSYNASVTYINAINPFTMEEFGTNPGSNFNYYLNLSVNYTLFNGGVRKRNVENAQVQELQSQYRIEDLRRTLRGQVENQLVAYNEQRALLELTNAQIETARQNMALAEERFKGGLISSFDYRSVQLSYINASQARLNNYYNMKLAEISLLQVVGALVQ